MPNPDAESSGKTADPSAIRSLRELRHFIRADLHRYQGCASARTFARDILINPGFKYTFWMRVGVYLRGRRVFRPLYIITRLIGGHYSVRYGIVIPFGTRIGPGFYIGHFGGIVVSGLTSIGRNCNISQGVTIGLGSRGPRKGIPQLGDNVYIGPGAKLLGNIKVGNNVAIGANCVVTKDVPDNAVVAGVPGKVLSFKGAEGYVVNTDYPQAP